MLAVCGHGFDSQNEAHPLLSYNSLAFYLIHPPILIGFAILLHGLTFPPVAKAALLTVLATIGSFAASALVLRNSPLRRIIYGVGHEPNPPGPGTFAPEVPENFGLTSRAT